MAGRNADKREKDIWVVYMTVKELKDELKEMPDNAEVLVIDPMLMGNSIKKIEHRESTIFPEGIVRICTFG